MIGPSEASLAPLVAGAGASEENASAETRLLDAAAAGSPELVHQLLTSRVSVQHAVNLLVALPVEPRPARRGDVVEEID